MLTLGNVSDAGTQELLHAICPDVHAVKGEFDLDPSLLMAKVVVHGQFRIGIISGFSIIPNDDPDALAIAARQLDVDLLLWAGSHRLEAFELDGKFLLNPGSITGALSHGWVDSDVVTPSFCLLDVQGLTCTIYIYSLVDDNVKVEKVVFKKEP